MVAALLDEKRLFSNLQGSVTLFCVNIEAKCHLSLLLCFVCLIVLRENCTTSLQISKRWADAILYFKKHMGPTLHFVLLVPADNLNLALYPTGLAVGPVFKSSFHCLLAVWLWTCYISILCLTFHHGHMYLTEFL